LCEAPSGPFRQNAPVPFFPAVGIFLVPVLLAIAGAVVAGRNQTAQLIGALVGLGLGMVVSIFVARWIATHRSSNG